jgi:TonB family protein
MLNWTATIWPVAASVAIKSSLVLAAAWVATLVMRRCSAAARHVVWTACMAALVALPLLSISLPALRLPGASAILPGDAGIVFRSTATAPNRAAVSRSPVAAPSRPASPGAPVAAPIDLRMIALCLWATGLVAGLIQMTGACLVLRRLRRAAMVSPDSPQAALLANSMGIETPVRVLETPRGIPMTFGMLTPTVLMPAAAREWSEVRRRIVLLHELAHVRRGDAATHLLARAALVLYWWNPLAWTAAREFLKERERAADDLVLEAGAGQSEYAGHLLEVARSMQAEPAVAGAAAIAMARPSQLEGRLLAILADGVNRRQPGRAMLAIAGVVAMVLVLPLAAIRAQSTATPTVPPDVDAAIRAATSQKNHELLEPAAAIYENLNKYQEAQSLREASLAIREQEGGKSSPLFAEGLVLLGKLAAMRGANQNALDYYTRALEYGDRPEIYPALFAIGMNAWHKQDTAVALDSLRRASAIARNGNDAGRAVTWMANIQAAQPETSAAAESSYRTALSTEKPDSLEQAVTLDFFARYLREQNRGPEADALSARSAEIHKALAGGVSPKSGPMTAVFKVGKDIAAPKLLTKVEPSYSEDARYAQVQGTVTLYVVIDTDGMAKDVRVLKSVGYGLDEKAVEAVGKWTFQPGTRGGEAVRVEAQIEINFRLM